MTHTRIALPKRGSNISYRTILDGLVFLIVTSICIVMVFAYLNVDNGNLELSQKINTLYSTRPVSAIATPVITPGAQQSLIPVDRAEAQAFLSKLQSIALVPEDEAPTLATIVEVDRLREEVFFRNAVIDDKLFVYQQARLAILYRPSVEKIVNMATLFDQSAPVHETPSITPKGDAFGQASPEAKLP